MKERVDQEMNRTASVSAAELPTLQFSVGIGCIHYIANQLGLPWLRMPLSLIKVIKLQHRKDYEKATWTVQYSTTISRLDVIKNGLANGSGSDRGQVVSMREC
jgi:hypothetical protein